LNWPARIRTADRAPRAAEAASPLNPEKTFGRSGAPASRSNVYL
jgi:hypothetical protein